MSGDDAGERLLNAIFGLPKKPEACVRASTLRKVITEALEDAERLGMDNQTRDEWVSICILGSNAIPLSHHLPAPGGGPCPTCGDEYGSAS